MSRRWVGGAVAALALGLALAAPAAAHAPHDVVTELGMSPGFLEDRTLFAAFLLTDHPLFGRSTDGGLSWQIYGLPMLEFSIQEFAFSTRFAEDGIAFAATTGGVWRTTDAGLTWAPASSGLPHLSVRSLAVSPDFASDGVVLAATDGGCARSVDGGLNWSAVDLGFTETDIRVVRFAPEDAALAYAGGRTLHASVDGGVTWAPRVTFTHLMETLALSPGFAQDETLMLAFGRFGQGVRVSTNGGLSFNSCHDGLTDLYVFELAIAEDGTVFAATKTGGCYRADVPGGEWTLQVNGFEELSDLTEFHHNEALVSPGFASDRLAFIGAYEGLYVTHDGGDTWRQSDVYNQYLNRHIVFSPDFAQDNLVFCGNYGGGVFQYTAGGGPDEAAWALPPAGPGLPGAPPGAALGASPSPSGTASSGAGAQPNGDPFQFVPWQARSNALSALYCDALAISPAFPDDRTLFYGYTNLGRSTDGGAHWTALPKPLGVSVVRRIGVSPDFAKDRLVLFGSGGEGIWRSVNGGDSFIKLLGGLPGSLICSGIGFSPDFATDRTVFLSSRNLGVYRSTNAAATWVPVNNGLTNLVIRTFVVSPDFAADSTAFAGTVGDGVFVTHDAGLSWAPANTGLPPTGPGGGPQIIESIVISPAYATDRTAFVATLNDGVFRSDDGCLSWTAVNTGLPRDSVRTLGISPNFAADRLVLAGTYGWTYETRDAGATWVKLRGGIRVDETAATVYRGGNWVTSGNPKNNGGSAKFAVSPGAWEELQFYGDRIVWYANTGWLSGIASVSIDGAAPRNVDLYRQNVKTQEPVFEQRFDEPGWHVIRVTNTGQKNPDSKFTRVDSDGYFHAF